MSSIFTARCADRRHGAKRKLGTTVGALASAAIAFAFAAPAWATVSATATLAPIGSGSYLLTVTNTGSEPITGVVVIPIGFTATSIVPTPACQLTTDPIVQSMACSITVAPTASTQVCYAGHALGATVPHFAGLVESNEHGHMSISSSPAVASCPLPGLIAESPGAPGIGSTPGTSGTPGTSSTPGSGSTPVTSAKGEHSWSHAQCKSAYKAWTRKHHHATRSRKRREATQLHKTHGCPLSILK